MQRESKQNHLSKISRVLSVILIVLLLFSGCAGNDPGKASDSTKTTGSSNTPDGSSSRPTEEPSEMVIKTLQNRISEWTEGQLYPGSYQKGTAAFKCPEGSESIVAEREGTLYASGRIPNAESTGSIHVVKKYQGTSEKEILLPEIRENFKLSGLYIGDGTIYLLAYPAETAMDTENSHIELFIYTAEGEFKLEKKLTELLDAEKIIDTSVSGFTDYEGDLWLRIPEAAALYRINPDGQVSLKVTIPEELKGTIMPGREENELVSALKTDSGVILGRLNIKTGASESYTLEGLYGVITGFQSTQYDILVMTEKSLYGVTLGEPVLVTELLVFTDLGVDQSILKSIEEHEDGSLSMLLLGRGKTEGEKVSLKPQTTKVREGLTLACLKSNDYIVYAVSTYNTAHPDNKITIKQYYDKYAIDASETDALNRLNSDLMDGTAGDIICLDGLNFSGEANAYLKKGLFLDLYELMDSDPEFNKEDYFTDVFRVNESNGKLYRLVPFFTLNTKYGRVDDVGETTHLDESILFETDPVTNLYGPLYRRTEFIHDLLVFSLGDAQDRNAALYEISRMASYIEVAGKLPEYEQYDADGTENEAYSEAVRLTYSNLLDNVTILYKDPYFKMNAYFWEVRYASTYLGKPIDKNQWSRMTWEEHIEAYRNAGVRLSFAGFPVKEGCGSAVINIFSLAIPSQTESARDAWDFLKQTLSDSYQSTKKLSYEAVPVNKESFENYIQQLFSYQNNDEDPSYLQSFIVEVGESEPKEEFRYLTPTLQQWMVNEFIDLLGDITLVDEVDPYVEAIITEEIEKYCDSRQTAEEAARNIAERVELYADEQ